MPITKPMLAGKCEDVTKLKFPLLCTPKLDGIRCVKTRGQALSRKFLPIPNHHIRKTIERLFPDGCDGEIIVPNVSFNETSGAVMRHDSEPVFKYFIFDYVKDGLDKRYADRMMDLRQAIKDMPVQAYDVAMLVLPVVINNQEELDIYEADCLEDGYEGVMMRSPDSPYKLGRSTEKEGYLLKLKRFEDSEAEVLELVEKMRNDNEAQKDNVGHTKRQTLQENMTPMNTLGSMKVRDVKTGVEFSIGSGLDDATRDLVWKNKAAYIGKLVKYKHQPSGAKEQGAPRFPVFLGFRDARDMD